MASSAYPKLADRYRGNSVLSVTGSVVREDRCRSCVPDEELSGRVQIVDGPLKELDTGLWVLAHPDIRHLQRVKLLFDPLKDKLVL